MIPFIKEKKNDDSPVASVDILKHFRPKFTAFDPLALASTLVTEWDFIRPFVTITMDEASLEGKLSTISALSKSISYTSAPRFGTAVVFVEYPQQKTSCESSTFKQWLKHLKTGDHFMERGTRAKSGDLANNTQQFRRNDCIRYLYPPTCFPPN